MFEPPNFWTRHLRIVHPKAQQSQAIRSSHLSRRSGNPQNVLSIEGTICMCESDTIHIHVYIHIVTYLLKYMWMIRMFQTTSQYITIDDENQTDPWDFNRPNLVRLWDYNGWMAKKTHLFDHQPLIWLIPWMWDSPNALNHPKKIIVSGGISTIPRKMVVV